MVVSYRRFGSTFRSHLKGQARPMKMRPTGCTERSVNNYQHTLRNIPEEQKFHLLRGGGLERRLIKLFYKCKIFSVEVDKNESLIKNFGLCVNLTFQNPQIKSHGI